MQVTYTCTVCLWMLWPAKVLPADTVYTNVHVPNDSETLNVAMSIELQILLHLLFMITFLPPLLNNSLVLNNCLDKSFVFSTCNCQTILSLLITFLYCIVYRPQYKLSSTIIRNNIFSLIILVTEELFSNSLNVCF